MTVEAKSKTPDGALRYFKQSAEARTIEGLTGSNRLFEV
jgi:hypothetical protein